MVKTLPIKEIQFKDLGNPAFTIETPEHHISLNTVLLAVGKKQSGKTFFITNLLNQLKEAGCMDLIFCISDTFDSNKKMLEDLNIDEENVYSPQDTSCINKIIAKIEQERDELIEYRNKMKILKELKSIYGSPQNLGDNFELFIEYVNQLTLKWKPPEHKWNGKKPVVGIFLDDIQSSPLIGSKSLRNLTIKHRHIGAFKDGSDSPIGCSLFFAIQNYTAQGNEGIPKSIRGNCNVVAVWKTGNMKELDLLATELSGNIPKEDILRAYNYVMDKDPENRHNFLTIDLSKKKSHPSPFRFNYKEWIILDEK